MTELLHDLLHDETDRLAVPAPPTTAVLARGRGLRRRRRALQGVAALVTVVVVAGLATAYAGHDDARRAVDPAGVPVSGSGAVFSIGPTVYLDDGRISAEIDDVTVKSLYYTSAGVLVRHGNNNNSDGGGPQRFSLVHPDGTVSAVGVTTEETVHATDPAQPYLAYAQTVGGVVHVLVHDVVTDQQVADVPVPGDRSDFSPLSIAGDTVYLGDGETVHVVDWRTGAVTDSEVLTSSTVSGGRAVVSAGADGGSEIVDATTGAVLVPAPTPTSPDEFGYFSLSPDGAHAIYDPQTSEQPSFDVYDVATGEHATIEGQPYDYGWSASGGLFSVRDTGELTTCSADTGACTGVRLDLPVRPGSARDYSDNLQLGGRTYES